MRKLARCNSRRRWRPPEHFTWTCARRMRPAVRCADFHYLDEFGFRRRQFHQDRFADLFDKCGRHGHSGRVVQRHDGALQFGEHFDCRHHGRQRPHALRFGLIILSLTDEETMVSLGDRAGTRQGLRVQFWQRCRLGRGTHLNDDVPWGAMGFPSANGWHHLVYTYDGNVTVKIYVDGRLWYHGHAGRRSGHAHRRSDQHRLPARSEWRRHYPASISPDTSMPFASGAAS